MKKHLGALTVGLALASAVGLAEADSGSETATGPREIDVTIVGAEDKSAPLAPMLREVARTLDAEVTTGAIEPLARVTIDLRAADQIVVGVEGRDHRVVRRTLPRAPSAEVLREEIGIVLGDTLNLALAPPAPSASASTSATTLTVPPVASTEPPPDFAMPTKPHRAASTVEGEIAPEIVVRGRDDQSGPVVGGGLIARAARVSGAIRPEIAFAAEVDGPSDIDAVASDLRVSAYAIRAFAGALVPTSSPRVAFEGLAGPGLDLLHVAPRATAAAATIHGATTSISPVLGAGAALRVRVGTATLALFAGADLDLYAHRYVTLAGDDRSVVFAPWRLRPFVALSVALPVLGVAGAE